MNDRVSGRASTPPVSSRDALLRRLNDDPRCTTGACAGLKGAIKLVKAVGADPQGHAVGALEQYYDAWRDRPDFYTSDLASFYRNQSNTGVGETAIHRRCMAAQQGDRPYTLAGQLSARLSPGVRAAAQRLLATDLAQYVLSPWDAPPSPRPGPAPEPQPPTGAATRELR